MLRLKRILNRLFFPLYRGKRCERCGYPMSWGRPYGVTEDGEIEPSWYYECDC